MTWYTVCKMPDIYEFLKSHEITYERFDHPAVFTCEEADKIREVFTAMPGVPTKNLFLRDKDEKRHFLVVVGHGKNVDLKALRVLLNVSKLSFGSAEILMKYLGVTPGAVTILGLMNDKNSSVHTSGEFNDDEYGQKFDGGKGDGHRQNSGRDDRRGHHVEVIFDQELWEKPLQCHPLVNTATLAISHEGILKFLAATRHSYKVLSIPGKSGH